ncbi:MAG: hypothetical protein LN566_05010 [Rickettsia endosymbiont of Stiretrus anchorago]|nr:hypothetical protein [Rickettsia endosymbiont of Stiretrus anchorago]
MYIYPSKLWVKVRIEGERVLQSLKEKTPSYTKEKGKELALNVFAAGVMRSVKGIASNAGKIYDKAERFFGKTNASKTTLPPSNTNSNNSIVKIIEKNTGAYKDKKYIFSQKKLASYLQSNEPHRIIAQGKEFRDVDRIIKTYGGSKKDWVKMSSSKTNISGSDLHFETHWVQNIKTGQKVEIKTVKVKGNWYVEQ